MIISNTCVGYKIEYLKSVFKSCFKHCYASFTFLVYLHCNSSSNICPLPYSNRVQGEVELVGQEEILIIVFPHISVWLWTQLCEGILGKMESFRKKPPGTSFPAGGLFKHQSTCPWSPVLFKIFNFYLFINRGKHILVWGTPSILRDQLAKGKIKS